MKLYRVTVEHTLFVHAADAKAAEVVALQSYHEEDPVIRVNVVGHPSLVEPEFRDTYPHTAAGSYDTEDLTCGQIMAKELSDGTQAS